MNGGQGVTTRDEAGNADSAEEVESEALKREEKRKKARLRKRGPYRKAHADW
jgi:hypothetical protein